MSSILKIKIYYIFMTILIEIYNDDIVRKL